MNRTLLRLLALSAMVSPGGAFDAEEFEPRRRRPNPEPPRRGPYHATVAAPPREPTPAELRAAEKRARRAERLELAAERGAIRRAT